MLQDGETALHKATKEGHVEVVKMLVKYGAAVDTRNKVGLTISCKDKTPHHEEYQALYCVDRVCIKFMLQDGDTTLHKAALRGHVEVVETLVDHGAATDVRNKV